MTQKNYRESWREELESAHLYRVLARVEKNERFQRLFHSLGEAALGQAKIWEEKVLQSGASLPNFRPKMRTRIVTILLRSLGPKAILPVLAAMKVRGISVYSETGEAQDSSRPHPERQHWASKAGGNLRAAVFGINDGLVSNTSLILGISGASDNPQIVLTSGIAGLLAGAFSMASGEYISMRSQRDLFEYQIGLERDELEEYPEEEANELALIYEAKGIPAADALKIAQKLIADPEKALDTLAREELGLNPNELGSPWGAAIYSFLSFALGAVLPLLPFLMGIGEKSLWAGMAVSGVSLFLIGALLSLFTGKDATLGGLRMLFVGAMAGAATFWIGKAVGSALR